MKKVVILRVYKGSEILKNESGEIKTENQLIKLEYPSLYFKQNIENFALLGFGKVEIIKVTNTKGEEVTDKELLSEIQAIVNPVQPTTESNSSKQDEEKDEELTQIREKYKNVFGKKPHHTWSVEKITELIQEV